MAYTIHINSEMLKDIKLQYNNVFLIYTDSTVMFYDIDTSLLSQLTIKNGISIIHNNNQEILQLTNPIVDQMYIPKSDTCIVLTTHDLFIFTRIYDNPQVFWRLLTKYTFTFDLTQILVKETINNTQIYIVTSDNTIIYTSLYNSDILTYDMGDYETAPITQHIKSNKNVEIIIQNDKNIVSITKNNVNWYLPLYQHFQFVLPKLEYIFLDNYIFAITRDKMAHYIQPNGKLLMTYDMRSSINITPNMCQDNINKTILLQSTDNSILVIKQSLLNQLNRAIDIYDSVISFPNETIQYFYVTHTNLFIYTMNDMQLKLYKFQYNGSQYTLIDTYNIESVPGNVDLKFQMNMHNKNVIIYQILNDCYVINYTSQAQSHQFLNMPSINTDGVNIYKTYSYYKESDIASINVSPQISKVDILGLTHNEYNKLSILSSMMNQGNRLNLNIDNTIITQNKYYRKNFNMYIIPNTYIKQYTPNIENIIPFDNYKTLNILISHNIAKKYRNYKIEPLYLVSGQKELTFTENDKQLFGTLYYDLNDDIFSITRMNDKITINLLNRIKQDWQGNDILYRNIFDYYYSHLTDSGYQYRDFNLSIIYKIIQNIANINLGQFNVDIKFNPKSMSKLNLMKAKWIHDIFLFNIKMINKQQSSVYVYKIPLKEFLYDNLLSYNFLDFNIKLIDDIQNFRTDIPYYVAIYTPTSRIKSETSVYDIEFYNFNTIQLINNNENDVDNILIQIDVYNQLDRIRFPYKSNYFTPHNRSHTIMVQK